MKKSDWALVALNVFTAFMTFVSAVEGDEELGIMVFFLASVALALNTTVLVRRAREREDGARRGSEDEMDARTVLDLDARLEALERAQDASDAARWRALAATGQASGPADEPGTLADPGRRQNGDRA